MKGFEGFNDLERKRVSIRKRIRRDDLDSYFEERRRELLAAQQTYFPSNLREELQTDEKRYYFLMKINQELNQRQPSQWNSLIEELEMSLLYFQGNFDQFVNFKIIELLASVVCQNYYRLRIQHSILKILTQITNRQKVDNPAILEKIIMTNIIQTSINFMQSVDMPLDQQYYFLYFYASIARINDKFRNGLFQHGAGRLIVNYASKILQTNERNESLRYNLLGICSDFLKIFPVRQVKLRYPSITFVQPLLPLIIAFLSEGGSDRIIKISLLCLMFIVKPRNEQYFKRCFQSNIVPYLLTLTKVPMFAYAALNIISNLASSDVDQNTQQLSKLGIKDQLYQKNCQEDVDYRLVVLSLNIIDNLLTCRQEAMDSLNHPMWEILCQSLEHRENAVRIEAFHCLNTMLGFLDDPHFQFQILKKNKFIELAVSQLQDFKKRPPQLIQECLVLLDKYINLSIECGNMQAFHILQSIYKLSTLFQAMIPQIQNQIVLEKANSVYDCYMQKFIHVSL